MRAKVVDSRVAEFTRNFTNNAIEQRHTKGIFYQQSGIKKLIANKLAYEWKHIYRQLTHVD